MLLDLVRLTLGTFRRRGIRSWLTMLGIFIGIAAVVSLISLGDGLQTAITGQFSTLSPDRLIVQNIGAGFGPPGSTAVRKLTSDDVELIERIRGVELVAPRLIRVVSVEYNRFTEFEYVVSLPDNPEGTEEVYASSTVEAQQGRLLEYNDFGKVVLGHDFVEDESYGKPIRIGTSLTLQGKTFEVIGLLKETSSFQINDAIFMTEQDLKDVFNLDDEYDLIAVKVNDRNEVERVANDIARELRQDRDQDEGEEDFSVQTPLQALSTVNTVLTIINIIVTGIAALSLVVGGIGITNTMYTSVLERTREIGIMKAIGAKNSDILWLFLIESGLLGLVGGVVGAILGLGLAFGVSALASSFLGGIALEIKISLPLIIGAILFACVVGILSGILPAFRAARLPIVKALRS